MISRAPSTSTSSDPVRQRSWPPSSREPGSCRRCPPPLSAFPSALTVSSSLPPSPSRGRTGHACARRRHKATSVRDRAQGACRRQRQLCVSGSDVRGRISPFELAWRATATTATATTKGGQRSVAALWARPRGPLSGRRRAAGCGESGTRTVRTFGRQSPENERERGERAVVVGEINSDRSDSRGKEGASRGAIL